jgi:hypothetical protein
MIRFYKMLCQQHTEGKEKWETVIFSLFNCPDIPFLLCQDILHRFLALPLLSKSRDEISFKGEGCNTLCYKNLNYYH